MIAGFIRPGSYGRVIGGRAISVSRLNDGRYFVLVFPLGEISILSETIVSERPTTPDLYRIAESVQ